VASHGNPPPHANPAVSLVEVEVGSKRPGHHRGHAEDVDVEATEDVDEDVEEVDSSADDTSNDGEDVEVESGIEDGTDEEQEDTGMDENDDTGDDVGATPRKTKRLSMLAVVDLHDADKQTLNENGYLNIASARSNRKMERFVKRLIDEMSFEIIDVGGLKGMVPFYSGQKATQSFEALTAELLSTARMSDGWLLRAGGRKAHPSTATMHQNKKVKKGKPALLLQTNQTKQPEHHEKPARAHADSHFPQVSLLSSAATGAVRVVHKVPDLAVALFGSRTLIVLCTVGLVGCIFCLDERKRTGGKHMDHEYQDPLNMSPNPPVIKGAKDAPPVSQQ